MREQAQVVVIGGGVVGCSVAYHLAQLGQSDVLLLESDELTSGSTWHAAGNLPTFSTSWSLLKLQQYSAQLYRALAADSHDPINYHVTGSVRLAHTRARMDEFLHVQSMAKALGMDYTILSPQELQQRYPMLDTRGLLGALWDPLDGDIDPSQLTQALARGARALGVEVKRHTRVTGLVQQGMKGWLVHTNQGTITCRQIVNAAGYRAAEIMRMVGRDLPLCVMAHQYLVTEDCPELVAAGDARLPLLRDPDVSYYLRQERHGFILGPYEWQATAMWQDGMPEDFAHQLFNDDWERLEPYIAAASERVPLLARAGIKRGVNGPIPYSPDGNPYVGPECGLPNFFHCNTFSFGITQAGGAGKLLAEWMVQGTPSWDIWGLDRRRFGTYADAAYTRAKAIEVYQNEYASNYYPYQERSAGRPLHCSPLYAQLKAKGAQFGARGGFERAVYFDSTGSLTAPDALQPTDFLRARPWMPAVQQEVAAVRNQVGVMDVPGFSKYELSGLGARRYLDGIVCSKLPDPGQVRLAYALNAQGKIWSEFTIACLAHEHFYIMAAASAASHDWDVLAAGLAHDSDATVPQWSNVTLHDVSVQWGTLVVAGPHARKVLLDLCDSPAAQQALSNTALPWLKVQQCTLAGVSLRLLRISYVGELGYELHAAPADLPQLYSALQQAGSAYGLRDFGMYAMESLRIDKCYPAWKSDLESGFTPLQASLERFIDWDKPEFTGRAALYAARTHEAQSPSVRLLSLVLDEPGVADAPFCASVFVADQRVGMCTSGVWSHTLQRSVALAYVEHRYAQAGQRVSIDIYGQRCAAQVAASPLYDPSNARLRA